MSKQLLLTLNCFNEYDRCDCKQQSTNVILVEIESVFVLLYSNASFASMVSGQTTPVRAFSGSIKYITGQK